MVTGFFKKLTNKLFSSSSKFTKDLDEAVNEVSETEVEIDVKKIAHDGKFDKNLLKLFKNLFYLLERKIKVVLAN